MITIELDKSNKELKLILSLPRIKDTFNTIKDKVTRYSVSRLKKIKIIFAIIKTNPVNLSQNDNNIVISKSTKVNSEKPKFLFKPIRFKSRKIVATASIISLFLQISAPFILNGNSFVKAEQMCSVDVDVVLITDVSGSMNDGASPSKCEWSEIKPYQGGNTWFLNTKYNITEDWCNNVRNSFDTSDPVFQFIPLKYTAGTNSKITDAKASAVSFLNNFKSNDQSGLVSFSDTATLVKTLSNDHAATQAAVNALIVGGATNIGDAIALGTTELNSIRANSQANKIMVLLTDGKANKPNGDGYNENPQDVNYAKQMAQTAAGFGFKIFTVGLGSDGEINQTMLQDIANITNATYYHVPNGNGLSAIYDQIAYEICQYGSISGCKYQDSNVDGDITGENKLSGWEIILSGDISATQTTDNNGCYTFAGLGAGNYTVSEGANTTKSPFLQTYPQGNSHAIALADSEDRVNIDFANADNSMCQLTDNAGACVSDGQRTHNYTYSYPYCGQNYTNTVSDPTCACQASEFSRTCIDENLARVTYNYNFDFCGQTYTQEVTDLSCTGPSTCQATETSRTCTSNGFATVTYSWNEQSCGQDYTNQVADSSCTCVETEVKGNCSDSTHRAYTFTYNHSYCTQKPEEQREDATCNSSATYACSDGIDNDSDGLIDYPNDPGCSSSQDNEEINTPAPSPAFGGGGMISFKYELVVNKEGEGSITGQGVDCGSDCVESYDENTLVTLTASGANFQGWSGACSGTETTCTITMNGNKTVGAVFVQESTGSSTSTTEGEVLGAECGIYLLEYIKTGANNNPEEVKKLQLFLNEEMGSNLPITGFYGSQTREVLEQFQLKYKNEILKPWVDEGLHNNVDIPTGYVYKTTKRWINLIKCPSLNIPMPGFEEDRYTVGQSSSSEEGEVLGESTTTEESTSTSTTTDENGTDTEAVTEEESTTTGNTTSTTIVVLLGVLVIGYAIYQFRPRKQG